tara:strand:+ start:107 stop:1918 length:1812 start_codon:yes stop_codon:yes gene_type:complete
MKKKYRPLFLQLLYFLLPIYIIGIAAQFYFIVPFIESFYLEETKDHLTSKAYLIKSGIDNKVANNELQNFIIESSKKSKIRITIMDTLGSVFADSDKNPMLMENHRSVKKRDEIENALKDGIGASQRYSTTTNQDMLYVAVLTNFSGQPFIIRTSASMSSLETSIGKARDRIILINIIILIFITISVILVSRFISQPLFLIGKGARRISSGEMLEPIPMPEENLFINTEEILSITVAINDMVSELKRRINTITKERNEQENIIKYINIIQYSMSEGLLTFDLKKRFTTINNAAAKYLDLDLKEDIGKTYDKKIKNKDLKKIIKTLINKGRPVSKEIRIGKLKKSYFSVNGTLLRGQKSKKVGCLLVMTDVTRLKQLEAMRRVFVANVSHELKTPITSIAGYVETAQGDIPDENKNNFLKKALKQTNRLNSIIDDLLRLSRIEALQDEDSFSLLDHDLVEVVNGSIEDLDEILKKYKTKVITKHPQSVNAFIDMQLMQEAITNLLENAIKYGNVDTDVWLDIEKGSDGIHIDISNIGEPIPEKEFDKIFNRFYRLDKSRSKKTGGTGLGLAIVKHISIVHNGKIEVRKSDEKKTIFRFTLPVSQ